VYWLATKMGKSVADTGIDTLKSKPYTLKWNHTYGISLTIEGQRLSMTLSDPSGGTVDSLSVVDQAPFPAGAVCSINGMQGDLDTVFFDNFVIRRKE
jgi:hypothetical protein